MAMFYLLWCLSYHTGILCWDWFCPGWISRYRYPCWDWSLSFWISYWFLGWDVFIFFIHYNRCKRLHPLLANVMHILHFKSFLPENGPLLTAFLSKLKELQENPSPHAMLMFEQSVIYAELMDQYEQFSEDTSNYQHVVMFSNVLVVILSWDIFFLQ